MGRSLFTAPAIARSTSEAAGSSATLSQKGIIPDAVG